MWPFLLKRFRAVDEICNILQRLEVLVLLILRLNTVSSQVVNISRASGRLEHEMILCPHILQLIASRQKIERETNKWHDLTFYNLIVYLQIFSRVFEQVQMS